MKDSLEIIKALGELVAIAMFLWRFVKHLTDSAKREKETDMRRDANDARLDKLETRVNKHDHQLGNIKQDVAVIRENTQTGLKHHRRDDTPTG